MGRVRLRTAQPNLQRPEETINPDGRGELVVTPMAGGPLRACPSLVPSPVVQDDPNQCRHSCSSGRPVRPLPVNRLGSGGGSYPGG
jgi:hypothetical protein